MDTLTIWLRSSWGEGYHWYCAWCMPTEPGSRYAGKFYPESFDGMHRHGVWWRVPEMREELHRGGSAPVGDADDAVIESDSREMFLLWLGDWAQRARERCPDIDVPADIDERAAAYLRRFGSSSTESWRLWPLWITRWPSFSVSQLAAVCHPWSGLFPVDRALWPDDGLRARPQRRRSRSGARRLPTLVEYDESHWELRATTRTIPDRLERTAPGHDTGIGRIRPDYEVDGARLLTLAADGVAGTYSTSLLDRRLRDLFAARVDDIPAGLPLEQRNTWAAAAERAADAVAAYDPAPARRAIETLAARHATPEACREIAEVRITYPQLNHEVLGTSTRKLIGLYGVDHIGTRASTVIAPRSVIELFNLPSTTRGEQRQRQDQRPDSDSRRVDRHSRIERT